MPSSLFPPPVDKSEQEFGTSFAPKFDQDGLITAIVCDAANGELLMVGHMNDVALMRTLETGEAHYWSRSRQELWHKGATSGNVQKVIEIATDCDQDAILLKVEVSGHGATCHTGQYTCFYRKLTFTDGKAVLKPNETKPLFDPKEVYNN